MRVNLKLQLQRLREANGSRLRSTERTWYRIEQDEYNDELLLVRDDLEKE